MTPIDADMCTETVYGLYSIAEDFRDEREERVDALRYKLDWNTSPTSKLTMNMIYKTNEDEVKEISQKIQPLGKVSGGANLTYEWGGDEPPEIKTGLYIEANDDQGGSTKIQIDYFQIDDRNIISVDAKGSQDTQTGTSDKK